MAPCFKRFMTSQPVQAFDTNTHYHTKTLLRKPTFRAQEIHACILVSCNGAQVGDRNREGSTKGFL